MFGAPPPESGTLYSTVNPDAAPRLSPLVRGGVSFPILLVPPSVNQMFPSGPAGIPFGSLPDGSSDSVATPPLVIPPPPPLPLRKPLPVNHSALLEPVVISLG